MLGERPALAVADGFDEIVIGLVEIHLAGLDEDEPCPCAGQEREAGIDEAGHGAASPVQEIRSMLVAPVYARSHTNHANAIPELALRPSHPALCIIGRRLRNW